MGRGRRLCRRQAITCWPPYVKSLLYRNPHLTNVYIHPYYAAYDTPHSASNSHPAPEGSRTKTGQPRDPQHNTTIS